MAFSREEFDIMVLQLLYSEPVSFDMLCQIAERTLLPQVRRLCYENSALRGKGCEQDIMQNIHLRLIQVTVPGFLLRGPYGTVNDDPDGFRAWTYKVAENLVKDYADGVRKREFRTVNPDVLETIAVQDPSPEESEERIAILKQAFSIVLSADVRVYKVLTWLAQSVYFLNLDTTRIDSNEYVIAAFENKTLEEMYEMILAASRRIPWLQVTDRQHSKIVAALEKPWKGNQTFGQTQYKEFFMKHNGEISPKKSISDWVYRLDEIVNRRMR